MKVCRLGQSFLGEATGFSRPLDVHTEPGQQLVVTFTFSSRGHAT